MWHREKTNSYIFETNLGINSAQWRLHIMRITVPQNFRGNDYRGNKAYDHMAMRHKFSKLWPYEF